MISAGVEKLLVPAIISGPDWVMFPPALILRLPVPVTEPSVMPLASLSEMSSPLAVTTPPKLLLLLLRLMSSLAVRFVVPEALIVPFPLWVISPLDAVRVRSVVVIGPVAVRSLAADVTDREPESAPLLVAVIVPRIVAREL